MKKLIGVVFGLLLTPMVWAANFQEGVHYKTVNAAPVTGNPTVTEYFSYYCGHCYNFAKQYSSSIKTGLAEGITFEQAHVDFINGGGPNSGTTMSRAQAVAQVLNVIDPVEMALFSAIHDGKNPLGTNDSVKQVFVDNGVSATDYENAAKSFHANALVKKWKQDQSSSGIRGVPALVVNHKYQVEMGSITSMAQLQELLNYLAMKK